MMSKGIYECSLGHRYTGHAHTCPTCICEAKELLRQLHDERKPNDLYVRAATERIYVLLSDGIGMDGRISQKKGAAHADPR